MQNRLGADGYAFAKVDPVPTPNEETHEVSLTFFIDPGNRVYVRNITFGGAHGINDEVLRREMRQLEGGWLSNIALERSKQRIQRLPYVKKVDSETTPVAGRAGSRRRGIRGGRRARARSSAAASATPSPRDSCSTATRGRELPRHAASASRSEANTARYAKVYSFSHTNPYITIGRHQSDHRPGRIATSSSSRRVRRSFPRRRGSRA